MILRHWPLTVSHLLIEMTFLDNALGIDVLSPALCFVSAVVASGCSDQIPMTTTPAVCQMLLSRALMCPAQSDRTWVCMCVYVCFSVPLPVHVYGQNIHTLLESCTVHESLQCCLCISCIFHQNPFLLWVHE